MKARFFAIAAMVLSLASCQRDQAGLDSVVAGEQDVNITVALPEVTRATNSEVGALGNIDLTQYDIRYILEVYEGTELAKERFVNYEDDAKTTKFSMRLIPGRDYRFVVWADFVLEDTQANLHYNTTDLKSVVANHVAAATDESRDAYTAICDVANFSSAKGIPTIELKRPFGKLRVQTTDVNQMTTLRPVGVTVTYVDTKFANKFNAFTSEAIADYVAVDPVTVDLDACKYTNENPEANGLQTLYADYFFATESGDVKFELDVELNDRTFVPTLSFNTYIPVMRNVLTTVRGNLLTDGASIEVIINDTFEKNTFVNMVSTPETLAQVLTANEEVINVTLVNDIDLPISSLGQITGGSGEYKLGGEDTKAINIDLNGHKLNITTTYWSNLGAKNENAIFTIKNGTMTSSQATGTWNSYDLSFSNCNYVFEDVVFDKAIALCNVGVAVTRAETTIARKSVTMKNVTINESHDYYAMWISAVGQTVNIEGLTINSLGRGIKIDEQYLDDSEVAKVTLNINGADFNTKKKAAILVKSEAGADITLSNVDIADAFDKANAVWVDEDSKDYADLVTVTGGSKAVEGQSVIVADKPEDFANAISKVEDGGTIMISSEVTMPYFNGKEINLVGTNENAIVKQSPADHLSTKYEGATLNFENITLVGEAYRNDTQGYQKAAKETYKNCHFVNYIMFAGDVTTVTDCTFENEGQYFWTGTADNITFTRCKFNGLERAVKVCTVGNAGARVVTFNECEFKATTQVKAAIEIDGSKGSSYTVNINNCTESGFAKGANTGLSLFNVEGAENVTVVVDGSTWKGNGLFVDAAGNPTVSSQSALTEAAKTASEITLLAGEYTMPAINNKEVTIVGSRDVVLTVSKPNMTGADVTLEGITVKGSGYATGVQHVNTVTYDNVKVVGEMCLYGEAVTFNNCEFELANGQYIWTYGCKNSTFNNCVFNTAGKAILVYNEGSGATKVTVEGCTFNATAGAKAGAIANQNCAAIEIDNFQSSGVGVAHNVTASNNTVGANFSGEWRIKNYVAGAAINVNGTAYTQIAIDGKLMTIDPSKNVTVL